MPGIFISYRRQDSLCQAGRLYDQLCLRFGQDRVFMDFSTIKPGEEWEKAIEDGVASAELVLAVLGKEWVRVADAEGHPRLRDPRDWVRLEISAALKHGIRIVPTLVQGASMPPAAELPEDLLPLLKRQAVTIGDVPFDKDVDGLVESVRSYVHPIAGASRHALVIGQVIVDHGGHQCTVTFGSPHGAVLGVNKVEKPVERQWRTGPAALDVAEAAPAVLDRQPEWNTIRRTIRAGGALQLFGEDGAGKTVLLRKAAADSTNLSLRDGVVFLPAYAMPCSDVLQSIFEAFHEDAPAFQPSPVRLHDALQAVRALVIADDFDASGQELQQVRDTLPASVLLTASEAAIAGRGESIEIGPLPEDECVLLFGQWFGQPVDTERQRAVPELCRRLDGHPLRIAQVASAAREQGWSVEELGARLKSGSAETAALECLPDDPRFHSVLTVLAGVGGAPLSSNHLEALVPDSQEVIQQLEVRALIQRAGAGHRICRNLLSEVRHSGGVEDWPERLLGYFTAWARSVVEEPSTIAAAAPAVIAVLRGGARAGLHEGVLQLVRAVESAVAVCRRWGWWEMVLRFGLDAARQLNDHESEAWILHQLGTRSAALGMTKLGREQLTQALHMRESMLLTESAAITRRNLNELELLSIVQLVPGPAADIQKTLPVVAPVAQRPWWQRWPVLVGAAIVLLCLLVPLLWPPAVTAKQEARVTVVNRRGVAPPRVLYFYAMPSTTRPGGAEIRWWVEGATRIRIDPAPAGGTIPSLPSRGESFVPGRPGATFRLIVDGPNGSSTTETRIPPQLGADPVQVIRFFALPPVIEPGQSTLLCWQTTGHQAAVSPGNLNHLAATGCIPVNPGDSTTYTLNTTNANWSWPNPFRAGSGGSKTLPMTIVVNPGGPVESRTDPQLSRLIAVPAYVDFGDRASATQDVELRNTGTTGLRLTATLVGNMKAAFSLRSDQCSGKLLAKEETCKVAVQFHPAFGGEHASLLKITSDDNAEWGVPLVGRWTAGSPQRVQDLAVFPKALAFSALPFTGPKTELVADTPNERITRTTIVSEQEKKVVRVVNRSPRTVALGMSAIVPRETDFRFDHDDCSSRQLPPRASCSISISYSPSAQPRGKADLQIDRRDNGEKIAPIPLRTTQ